MIARATDGEGRLDTGRLLRTFGYGTPNPERLFYSAGNNLTLIAQDSLQPFFKDEEGDGGIKTKDMNTMRCLGPGRHCRICPSTRRCSCE